MFVLHLTPFITLKKIKFEKDENISENLYSLQCRWVEATKVDRKKFCKWANLKEVKK